jgi:hypothetical protein
MNRPAQADGEHAYPIARPVEIVQVPVHAGAHPRPVHRDEHHHGPADTGPGGVGVQQARHLGDGQDEDQVEEQLDPADRFSSSAAAFRMVVVIIERLRNPGQREPRRCHVAVPT